MNKVLDNNTNLINQLRINYPEAFSKLVIDGEFIKYNDEKVSIKNYNLYDLISGENPSFGSQLSLLSSEDVFKIIRINVIYNSSFKKLNVDTSLEKNENNGEKRNNKEDLEKLKKVDEMMKRVSIVSRKNSNGFNEEFINIVDSNGNNHMYYNDFNINIIEFYAYIKNKFGDNHNVTPEELIHELDEKVKKVSLTNSFDIIGYDKFNEDFQNKIRILDDKNRSNPLLRVSGNQDYDITVVSDISDPEKRDIYTYERNKTGDLVSNIHGQVMNENQEIDLQNAKEEKINEENDIKRNIEVNLVSEDRFYKLIYKSEDFTQEEQKQVNDYYSFFADCMIYENFLEPEILNMLNKFQYRVMEFENNGENLTIHQQEAIQKYHEMLKQKMNKNNQVELTDNKELTEDKGKQLKLVYDNKDSANGSISTLQAIWFILGTAVILIAVTLLVI